MESEPKNSLNEAELLSSLKEIMATKVAQEGIIENHNRCVAFAQKLEKEFGILELRKYKTYHLLIGTSSTSAQAPHFDLEGGIIEKFIREEL